MDNGHQQAGNRILLLSLSALGIVYGDIGTSPMNVFMAHIRSQRRNQTSLAYFRFQKHGTSRIGIVFGPVMFLWFATPALLGIIWIVRAPQVLAAINFLLRIAGKAVLVHDPQRAAGD